MYFCILCSKHLAALREIFSLTVLAGDCSIVWAILKCLQDSSHLNILCVLCLDYDMTMTVNSAGNKTLTGLSTRFS